MSDAAAVEPTGPRRASEMDMPEPEVETEAPDIAEPEPEAPEPEAPEPAAAKAPKAAEPEPDAPEPEAETKPGSPNAGFAAMRAEAKAAKARADAAEAKAANYERTFQEILRRQQQPAAPVSRETVPDPDTDPVAYLKHLAARVDGDIAARTAAEQQQAGHSQQMQAVQQLAAQVAAQETLYRAEQPDYDAAVQHLRQARLQELTEVGYSQIEAKQLLEAEFLAIADRAVAQGNSAPEKVYALAKRRGYGPAKAAAVAPKVASAVERVETMARAQQQGGTRAASGGGTADPSISLEYLASLPPGPAFDKAWEKAKRQGLL